MVNLSFNLLPAYPASPWLFIARNFIPLASSVSIYTRSLFKKDLERALYKPRHSIPPPCLPTHSHQLIPGHIHQQHNLQNFSSAAHSCLDAHLHSRYAARTKATN